MGAPTVLLPNQTAPQFRNSLYHQFVFEQLWRNYAQAAGFEPIDLICPNPETNNILPSLGSIEIRVSVLPMTYIWAISGSSSHASGFTFNILDLGTRDVFFSQAVNLASVSQAAAIEGITYPLFHLPQPRMVLEPGQLSVTINNLATANNTVQLVLFAVEPASCRPIQRNRP